MPRRKGQPAKLVTDNADVESENQNGNTCSDKGSGNISLNEAAKYLKKIGMEAEESEYSVVDSSASPIPFDEANYWKKMGIEMEEEESEPETVVVDNNTSSMEAEESEPEAVVVDNNTPSLDETNYMKKMGMEVEEEEPE